MIPSCGAERVPSENPKMFEFPTTSRAKDLKMSFLKCLHSLLAYQIRFHSFFEMEFQMARRSRKKTHVEMFPLGKKRNMVRKGEG